MVDILGHNISAGINITGLLDNTWAYILIIAGIGVLVLIGVGLLLFFLTYNRKIEFYENIAGRGYQRTFVSRARVIRAGTGVELLKALKGGETLSASGRKSGHNTYMFVKGPDGLWYNSIHGDFDNKLSMLDIEPVDRDVLAFHLAVDKLNHANYDGGAKKAIMIAAGFIIIMALMMIIGGWLIVGKINKGLEINAEAIKSTTAARAANAEADQKQLEALNNILNGQTQTGIVKVPIQINQPGGG